MLPRSPEPLLRCGVVTAPVTRWQDHDPYLAIRWMGQPTLEDNWEGYNSADLTKYECTLRQITFNFLGD